jgi:hypothetical protein
VVSAVVRRLQSPAVMTAALTGFLLLGLLLGIEPVGGDPDRLYRPLKAELARSLAEGRLPLWSDRFGLGIPLLAESHVAALYPFNWLFFGLLNTSTAYRLAMWLHYVLLALTTYTYSRFLRLSPHGAAVAAVGFTFCGFQAIHSSHEPFYHALPFLPLSLVLAEWYLASGRLLGLILLACAWGLQLTLGHFQLQAWTAGLVLALGLWRTAADGCPWWRWIGLVIGLAWGAAIAAIQLKTSWELAGFLGFTHRSFAELAFYSFPPAHWAELAIPCLLRGIPGGPEGPYWLSQQSTGYESCFYIGTVPLFLALLALGGARDRRLLPWLFFGAAAVLLAMLPRLWPAAYAAVSLVPGLGWFRAPGRYTLIASLGLCLAAGSGLDRASAAGTGEFRGGLALAWTFAIAAAGWAIYWVSESGFQAALGGLRLTLALGLAAVSWLAAAGLILAWRRQRVSAWWLVLATAVELGGLYYTSTTVWGAAVHLPEQSPILTGLAREQGVGRVAGVVANLPIWDGTAPILPYTGFAPLPPHPYFEFVKIRESALTAASLALLRRYGVTHGIWDGPINLKGIDTLLQASDPALDQLVIKSPGSPLHPLWSLVRYPTPFPVARAATRVRIASSESSLLAGISYDPDPQTVWYSAADQPESSAGPRAGSAQVTSWDGMTAVVAHDGTCDLVISRTYFPGWYASVNGGPEGPVGRAEAGIQAVRLPGSGVSRVRFAYRPSGLKAATSISIVAVTAAALGLFIEGLRHLRRRRALGLAEGSESTSRDPD